MWKETSDLYYLLRLFHTQPQSWTFAGLSGLRMGCRTTCWAVVGSTRLPPCAVPLPLSPPPLYPFASSAAPPSRPAHQSHIAPPRMTRSAHLQGQPWTPPTPPPPYPSQTQSDRKQGAAGVGWKQWRPLREKSVGEGRKKESPYSVTERWERRLSSPAVSY